MTHLRATAAAASLPRRFGAFALDYLVIGAWLVVIVAIGVAVRSVAPDVATRAFSDPLPAEAVGFALVTLPVALYFARSEGGPVGATWGKRRLGLRVVSAEGAPIGLGRSLVRTAFKFVPWELSHAAIWRFAIPGSTPEVVPVVLLVVAWLLIGAYLITALVGSRRTLYDRLSGTRVVAGET